MFNMGSLFINEQNLYSMINVGSSTYLDSFSLKKRDIKKLATRTNFAESTAIGAASGNTGNVPHEMEKNCCRKTMLFPKALFFPTTFPKIVKNSSFLSNFYLKNFKIFSKIPNNLYFSSKFAKN